MKMDYKEIGILSSLSKLTTALHTSKDMNKALDIIAKTAIDSLNVSSCTIKVLNERGNKLDIYSNMGFSDEFLSKVGPYGMFKNPLNKLALEGEQVVVEDIEKEKQFEFPQELLDEGIRSLICLPLKMENHVLGVISIYNNQPLKLDKEEMAFLENLAVHSTAALTSLRRFRRMTTLMNLSRTINSSLELNYVLKEIVVQAARSMRVRAASIRLLDESTNNLVFKTSFGLSKKYLKEIPFTLEQSPIDKEILEKKKIVEIIDMVMDPRIRIADAVRAEGLASMVCCPLLLHDKAIGILKIYTNIPTHLTGEEKNFMMAMSELSAVAIRNASLYEKLHSMFLATSSLSATIELDRVMELITIHAADYIKSMGAQILLWDKEKNRFSARSVYKISEDFVNSVNMNKNWCALETMKGDTIIVSNIAEDDRIDCKEATLREDIHSMISIPLKSMDRTMGLLQVYCKQPRNFSHDEIEFVTALANHGAISIENAKLHEHFKKKYEELVDDIYIWHDWTSYVIRS
ncbi:MAG: GAF domain-containing protein [Candidatus Eremiobacteraeota bacterium]|nr:GAF domain-containing protein [Candidatus Eremiobacteraeota bacterium]